MPLIPNLLRPTGSPFGSLILPAKKPKVQLALPPPGRTRPNTPVRHPPRSAHFTVIDLRRLLHPDSPGLYPDGSCRPSVPTTCLDCPSPGFPGRSPRLRTSLSLRPSETRSPPQHSPPRCGRPLLCGPSHSLWYGHGAGLPNHLAESGYGVSPQEALPPSP